VTTPTLLLSTFRFSSRVSTHLVRFFSGFVLQFVAAVAGAVSCLVLVLIVRFVVLLVLVCGEWEHGV
jgi:hypothetical protein